jgi:hypothetical protein
MSRMTPELYSQCFRLFFQSFHLLITFCPAVEFNVGKEDYSHRVSCEIKIGRKSTANIILQLGDTL